MATIGIIMPCYYNNSIIRPALEMLSWQTKKDEIEVIMINDCSPNTDCEYEDLRKEFSDILNIKYLKTEKNSGPGVARQLGLDNCSCDWVLFHDDDDILANLSIIEEYLKIIQSNNQYSHIAGKVKSNLNNIIFNTENNQYCLQGILFNNFYIHKYNIKFHPSLWKDEDAYFMTNYFLILNELNLINYYHLNQLCYIRIFNKQSLTNINSDDNILWFIISKIEQLDLYKNQEDFIKELTILSELLFPALEEVISYVTYIKQDTLILFFNIIEKYFDYINLYQNEILIFKQNYNEFINNFCQMFDFYNSYHNICKQDFSVYKNYLLSCTQNNNFPVLLSIIIPCYYNYKTIYPCFQSLWEQTKKDEIEVIMINDCSPNTDCEYEDLRELCIKNGLNIKYLKTEKNSGPGVARQLGLDNCSITTKYIMFLDDDDYLENNQIIYSIFEILNMHNRIGLIRGKKKCYNKDSIYDSGLTGLTGSIFSFDIIKIGNLTFSDIELDEDTLFFLQYNYYLNLLQHYVEYLELDLYIYCYRTDNMESITHNNFNYKQSLDNVSFLFDNYINKFHYLRS